MLHNYHIKQQYAALDSKNRLLILHPAAYASHRVLGQVLLEQGRSVYAHLPQNAANALEALNPVFEAFQQQLPQATMPAAGSNIAAWMADTLNKSQADLILEGYDGQTAQVLNETLLATIQQLKAPSHIILSGRSLAIDLIESLQGDGLVALLPTDPSRLLLDYTKLKPNQQILEVRAFGQGQVLVNGHPIDKWEGVLPRALFFFFIDRAMTTRDEIFRTFWGKLNTREATNVFHVTKRKISEILGLHPVVYGSGFYRISPEVELYYDVINFQEAVQNAAIASDEDAAYLYELAIDLYHDDFLSGLEGDWINKRRDEMRSTYTDALVGLARIYDARGEKEAALGLFLRAATSAPQREDLSRAIMTLYTELGRPKEALDAYKRLEKLLAKSLGVQPDPQTSELAERIRQQY